jgi:hypothetical protein
MNQGCCVTVKNSPDIRPYLESDIRLDTGYKKKDELSSRIAGASILKILNRIFSRFMRGFMCSDIRQVYARFHVLYTYTLGIRPDTYGIHILNSPDSVHMVSIFEIGQMPMVSIFEIGRIHMVRYPSLKMAGNRIRLNQSPA